MVCDFEEELEDIAPCTAYYIVNLVPYVSSMGQMITSADRQVTSFLFP